MDLAADLAEKTVALNALAINEMEARAIQVETSVNPSAKRLHTIISEMDAGTQTQSIRGCGTPTRTIAPLIGSHTIACTLQNVSS